MNKKLIILMICICIALTHFNPLTAQEIPQERMISFNNKIYYDSTFTIRYYSHKSGFNQFLKNPKRIDLLLYQNISDTPEIKPMIKEDDHWLTSISIEDTTVKMILFAFRAVDSLDLKNDRFLDNNLGQYWNLIFYHPNDKPVRGAHQTRAIAYSGFSNLLKENINNAITEIESELLHYPFNLSARLLFYSLLLKHFQNDDESKDFVKSDVRTILKETQRSETVLLYAISSYRMIGSEDDIRELQQQLIEINPKNTIEAWKTFQAIHEITDEKNRIKRLQSFLQEYPGSQFEEMALAQLATSFIAQDDTIQMIKVAEQLLQRARQVTGANALSRISLALLRHPQYMHLSDSYLQKAMNIIRTTDLSSKPPEVGISDWKDQTEQILAYYNTILARMLIKKGDEEKGVPLLQKESEKLLRSDIFFELADYYYRKKDYNNALQSFARASYFEDVMADSAYQMFISITETLNKSDADAEDFLNEQLDWVEERYKDKILSKRSIRKAPDFDLEEITGEWVRLSDQKGDIILLCYWASWSDHSKRLLMDLQELSELFDQDVLFLTVSVDKDLSEVNNFIDQNRFNLPVMLQQEASQDFKLQGVPTIFVIDRDLNIHFEHKGYRPDLMRILEIELDNLLELAKE